MTRRWLEIAIVTVLLVQTAVAVLILAFDHLDLQGPLWVSLVLLLVPAALAAACLICYFRGIDAWRYIALVLFGCQILQFPSFGISWGATIQIPVSADRTAPMMLDLIALVLFALSAIALLRSRNKDKG